MLAEPRTAPGRGIGNTKPPPVTRTSRSTPSLVRPVTSAAVTPPRTDELRLLRHRLGPELDRRSDVGVAGLLGAPGAARCPTSCGLAGTGNLTGPNPAYQSTLR